MPKNGLEFRSEHTLVITATNGDVSETPFYGYGRWCFALDYPGMSYEQYNIDPITGEAMNPVPLSTSLIGGLLHELGHGLNSPHVGPTYSQRNDSQFGTPLMGSGNQTYGKTPTFMHETTAAFMNNCQLSSKVQKTYYGETTASVEVTSVAINGDQCTIKGKFESTVNVNRVLIHFFNSNESHLQSNGGYTSIAFVTKPSGKTFEITIPIEELRVQTYKHKIGVTILMENGTRKAVAIPHTYRLEQEGGKYTLVNESIQNDGTWEVTTSHNLPKDDAIFNAPGSLVDGDFATCLSMVKPGKTYGGISVGADEIVWATVDFKKQTEFNTIILTNRNFQVYLNTKAISLYGSNTNNGSDWVEIKKDVKLTDNKKNTITFDTPIKYQYLKMTYDEWDKDNGSTMQFAEMELLNTK